MREKCLRTKEPIRLGLAELHIPPGTRDFPRLLPVNLKLQWSNRSRLMIPLLVRFPISLFRKDRTVTVNQVCQSFYTGFI
jgi:hypothetical protein